MSVISINIANVGPCIQKVMNKNLTNYSQTEQFVECVCQVRTNLLGLFRRINNRKQDEPIRIELKHTI